MKIDDLKTSVHPEFTTCVKETLCHYNLKPQTSPFTPSFKALLWRHELRDRKRQS